VLHPKERGKREKDVWLEDLIVRNEAKGSCLIPGAGDAVIVRFVIRQTDIESGREGERDTAFAVCLLQAA
jgi:hypothetical protein